MRIGVVIPARNEERSVGAVTLRLLRVLNESYPVRVVVCDNGSTDATAEAARQAGAEVVRCEVPGYGRACLSGIQQLGTWPDVLLFVDADGSSRPEEAPRLLAPLVADQADFVIGARTREAAMTPPQRWGTRLAVTLVRLRWGVTFLDMGPFRAIRRESLAHLGMTDLTWGWTLEMQILAVLKRLRTIEVPVSWDQRIAGASKISGTLGGVTRAGAKILWTFMRYAVKARY